MSISINNISQKTKDSKIYFRSLICLNVRNEKNKFF